MNRRNFLQTAPALAMASALTGSFAQAASARPTASRLADENKKPGDDWQLTRVRVDNTPQRTRSRWIEGYCSHQSVRAGEELAIMVSTDPVRMFTLEIFRMGYYGGQGARKMTSFGPLPGKIQPTPAPGENRICECDWEPSVKFKIPADWLSGVYLGRLTALGAEPNEGYWQSFVIFIVREDRPADIVFQCSDNTWQAYNKWPDNYSLYTNPAGSLRGITDVSFNRPYGRYPQVVDSAQSVGSGEFLLWEFPLCYWLEQHGYDVTYCSNSDLVAPGRKIDCKAFVSIGHDEYWDLRQYERVSQLRDAGVNLLFLSGNSVCFVAPFEPSSKGQPNRTLSRRGRYGGVSEAESAQMGPFPITDAPNENRLMGARTITPFNGGGDWIVTKPEHWMFEGAGLRKGDRIPGLVGWEFHGDPAKIPGLEVVAEGIALSGGVKPAHWTATIYPGPKGNFVFNASTIWWAQGLSSPPGHLLPWSHHSRPHGPDPRVQRITANLLRRAIEPR